jgi:hypothetical protein
MPPPS